jgi:predicted transcriptional regulator
MDTVEVGMVRTEVQLTDELAAHVQAAADRQRKSVAEVIEQALVIYVGVIPASADDARYAQAALAVGSHASGYHDLGSNHDAYFAMGDDE